MSCQPARGDFPAYRIVRIEGSATSRSDASASQDRLLPLWPDAGKALGLRSRSATYTAAKKGYIEVVRLGKLQKVSSRWLDRKLNGEIG